MERRNLAHSLHRRLMKADIHYREAAYSMGYNPVRVTELAVGTFERYRAGRRSNGHSSTANQPLLINLSDWDIEEILGAAAGGALHINPCSPSPCVSTT